MHVNWAVDSDLAKIRKTTEKISFETNLLFICDSSVGQAHSSVENCAIRLAAVSLGSVPLQITVGISAAMWLENGDDDVSAEAIFVIVMSILCLHRIPLQSESEPLVTFADGPLDSSDVVF